MPDRFVEEVLVHFGAEHGIGKFDGADLGVIQIEDVNNRH
jgi:hypothetical protein